MLNFLAIELTIMARHFSRKNVIDNMLVYLSYAMVIIVPKYSWRAWCCQDAILSLIKTLALA